MSWEKDMDDLCRCSCGKLPHEHEPPCDYWREFEEEFEAIDELFSLPVDHRTRCKREGTRDVIFLLQVPRWVYTGLPHTDDGEYGHDGEGFLLGDRDEDGNWVPREDAEYVASEALAVMETAEGVPSAVQTWETERVFLTREEGENYIEEFGHRYGNGCRIYGVPAEGRLAEILQRT